MVLLRFAPSPTGSLHLGGLRTALFNHLFARKLGGQWLLRIEDTDATRFVPGSVEGIIGALEWAGITPDHGPHVGGPHVPYFQSQRLDLYRSYADRLLSQGHAYRCFCSADRISEMRAKLQSLGSNSTYDRHCLSLTDEEVARRVRTGEKSVVRLMDTAVPARSSVQDMVFGAVKDVRTSLPTDTILLKSDLFPTYHLASVVDDHEMGITHVIRGEEWLPSLPLHLDLYACLKLEPPTFGHLPLLLNADGSKMSKRAAGVHVSSFMVLPAASFGTQALTFCQEQDYEPEAVLNWLFLLGLSTQPHDQELFTMPEMLQRFDIAAFSNHRSILDRAKLLHLNGLHLQRKAQSTPPNQLLQQRLLASITRQLPNADAVDPGEAIKVLNVAGERVQMLDDLPSLVPFLFATPDYSTVEAQKLRKGIPDELYVGICSTISTHLKDVPSNVSQPAAEWWPPVLQTTKAELGASNKHVMATLRHALTGAQNGPPLLDIVELFGRDRALERLQKAQASASESMG
ncbi:glutamyl-tRNA synthetase, partial [Auriculariales sp. MPI-PUGE-AT-0066]